jgi:hypothetical protein
LDVQLILLKVVEQVVEPMPLNPLLRKLEIQEDLEVVVQLVFPTLVEKVVEILPLQLLLKEIQEE